MDAKKLIKSLMRRERRQFEFILNRTPGLKLEYSPNRGAVDVLYRIFIEREYADFFPFHRAATIVDVGGHFGYFSLFAARATPPDARIIALEPAARNFETLIKNLESNAIQKAIALQMGLAPASGEGSLFLSPRSYNHSTVFPGTESEKVTFISLNDLCKQQNIDVIDFFKLDCEGAEYEVLFRTSPETLSRITTISLEFHDLRTIRPAPFNANDLAIFLKRHGFRIMKFCYSTTRRDLNFGKMVGTRIFDQV